MVKLTAMMEKLLERLDTFHHGVKSLLNSRKTAASNIDFRRSAGTVNNRGTWRVIVVVELPVPGRLPGAWKGN